VRAHDEADRAPSFFFCGGQSNGRRVMIIEGKCFPLCVAAKKLSVSTFAVQR
jgi:hypothetical protein